MDRGHRLWSMYPASPRATFFSICTMYQRNVDVDMLNVVKSVLADVSRVSPSSDAKQRCRAKLWQRANARNISQHTLPHSAYPRQPYIDTLYVLPPRRPKLVLTGISIPFFSIWTDQGQEINKKFPVISGLQQRQSVHNKSYFIIGFFAKHAIKKSVIWLSMKISIYFGNFYHVLSVLTYFYRNVGAKVAHNCKCWHEWSILWKTGLGNSQSGGTISQNCRPKKKLWISLN